MRIRGHHILAGALLGLVVLGLGFGAYRLAERTGLLGARAPLGDLPVVEVPAADDAPGREQLAIFLSADARWTRLDPGVARHLAQRGVPVAGWNSLRTYLAPRSPEEAAADLSRLISHYTRAWGREEVLLVGYAFAAEVLPVLVQRLPPEQRARIAGLVLVDFGTQPDLLARPGDWVGRAMAGQRRPALAAVRQIQDLPILCIEGVEPRAGACREIGAPNVTVADLPAERSAGLEGRLVSGHILRWLSALETG